MKLSVAYPALALLLGLGVVACDDEPKPTRLSSDPDAPALAAESPRRAVDGRSADVAARPDPGSSAGSNDAEAADSDSEAPSASDEKRSAGDAKRSAGEERSNDGEVRAGHSEKAEPAEDEQPERKVDRDADLSVKRLVLARGVSGREPTGASTVFSTSDARIYAFVEIRNAGQTPSEVFVSFKPEGKPERGRIRLEIGASPRWRTWAYTRNAEAPGRWQAIVRDPRGEEIGRASFELKAEGKTASAEEASADDGGAQASGEVADKRTQNAGEATEPPEGAADAAG